MEGRIEEVTSKIVEQAREVFLEDLDKATEQVLSNWEEHVKTIGIEKKGGAGSGFRGHSGLPGVHGGSRPRGSVGITISKPKPKPKPKTVQPKHKVGDTVTYFGDKVEITKVRQSEDGDTLYHLKGTGSNSKWWAKNVGEHALDKKPKAKKVDTRPPIKVYHGTGEAVAEAIKKGGLRTFVADEIDRDNELSFLGHARPSSVYFTTDKDMALMYANGYMGGFGGKSAIIEINIPASAFDNAIPDELGSKGSDFRLESSIPAAWISDIEVLEE